MADTYWAYGCAWLNWGYLAGWFDGAGHISIHERSSKWKRGTLSGTYTRRYVLLLFGDTNLELILAIREFLGLEHLKITTTKAINHSSMKQDYHKLQVTKRDDAARILTELESRCSIKKQSIEEGLAFLKTIEQEKAAKKKAKRKLPSNRLYY